MEGLDTTIIATSLPQIADAFGVTPQETSVALTVYLVSVSMWIAASGWLADRFEAKRVFIAALVIFMLGSFVCGISNNLTSLVVGRFLQGAGGAMMTPVGRLILARSFPRNQLVRAMNYMILPGLLGPMLGPMLGGAITTYFDWRWIFFINLPLGALAIGLALKHLRSVPAGPSSRFDVRGFVLVAIALVAVQTSLEVVAVRGAVSAIVWVAVAVALCAGFAYAWHARREDPILNLRLLRKRSFAVAVLGGSMPRVAIGATLFLFPLYFQLGLGATPVEAGYLLAVLAIGQMALRLVMDRLLRQLGVRRLLTLNCCAMAVLLAGLLSFGPGSSLWLLGIFLFFFGMLQAVQLSTLGALTFSGMSSEQLGSATAVAAVVQRLSMAVGIALAAILLGHGHGEADISSGVFVMPVLTFAGIFVLSVFGFRVLRKGDGDDLIENPKG